MFTDPTTLTINSVGRNYTTAWDGEFGKDIAAGNTVVKKVAITNGNSLLRISHSESKGVERHLFAVRDCINAGQDTEQVVSAHVVITFPTDDTSAQTNATSLAMGAISALTATAGALLVKLAAGEM